MEQKGFGESAASEGSQEMKNFDLGWIFEVFLALAKMICVPLYMYGWFKATLVFYGIGIALVNGWKG